MDPTLDLPPPVAGSWTPCRAVIVVLADDVLARPELLRAAAEAIVYRSDSEIVVYAPGADPAAVAPAIEGLLVGAGLDGEDTDVSLLCVPAEVGDAAMRDAGATVLGRARRPRRSPPCPASTSTPLAGCAPSPSSTACGSATRTRPSSPGRRFTTRPRPTGGRPQRGSVRGSCSRSPATATPSR